MNATSQRGDRGGRTASGGRYRIRWECFALLLTLLAASGCRGWGPHHAPHAQTPLPNDFTISAWDPPGGVVSAALAAAVASDLPRVVQVPQKTIRVSREAANLRAALDTAYDLERLRSWDPATQAKTAVVIRRDSAEELVPLPLVLRHRGGDIQLQPGDVLGLAEWQSIGIEMGSAAGSVGDNNGIRVQVQGWVARPGRYLVADRSLAGLLGDPELPAGEFLRDSSGELIADVLVVQRHNGLRQQRIFLPNELAAAAYPWEDERFWESFAQFRLLEGDTVAAVPSRLWPGG